MRYLLVPALILLLAPAAGADDRPNLALGRPVTFCPPPNYELTAKNGTDAADLTDGKLSKRKDDHIWFDAASVGYSYAGQVQIAVDLGEEKPVGEVAIRLLGGTPQHGIAFPVWVELHASADGVQYHRVAACSRFTPGDFERYGVPRDEGKAWVLPFRFRDAHVRARYVGLAFYGTGLTVTDEVYVYPPAAGAACRAAADAGPPSGFTVTGPRMYFHKPVLMIPTNVNAPTPVALVLPAGMSRGAVTAVLDLPAGVRLAGGRLGTCGVAEAKSEPADAGGTRVTFAATVGRAGKDWGRLYLRTDWPDGRRGTLRYRWKWPGGESPALEQPLAAVTIPPAPQPRRLMTGLGWWSIAETAAWPEALESFKALGLNTLPLFASRLKAPEAMAAAQEQIAAFRQAGFKVLNIDSTFHHMVAGAGKRAGELSCTLADGTAGEGLCPSYRGPLYAAEIDRLARQCVAVRADIVSCDIEIWKSALMKKARTCTRCQADFKASGAADWEAWQLAKGDEMWRAVADRLAAAYREAKLPPPDLGVYDFRPGRNYQAFWPFDRLYPKHLTNGQVSTYTPLYPYHVGVVGDEVRTDRALLPKSDLLPWITPGDAGVFPAAAFEDALLECYSNGARGVLFWSGRVWDVESLAAMARVIRMVAPVEDVIVDGQLVGEIRTSPAVRVSGMRKGDAMFLLVADYAGTKPQTVEVELPAGPAAVVVDAATGAELARSTPQDRRFRVVLEPGRARAVVVRPAK